MPGGITIHKTRLHLGRTNEDRHLVHRHRQTNRQGVRQFAHLERDSRSLHGIEALDKRHYRDTVDVYLRNLQRVHVERISGYGVRREGRYRLAAKRFYLFLLLDG